MGGILAADTLLAIVDDEPVMNPSGSANTHESRRHPKETAASLDPRKNDEEASLELPDDPIIFPAIVGICAFDTPYLVRPKPA